MGLLSSIFGGAKELSKIGNGVTNITNLLDCYEQDEDLSYIYFAAWICRTAVIDVVEKNSYPMSYKLYAEMHGNMQRLSIAEAHMLTLTRIMSKAAERGRSVEEFVQGILDKGDAFYRIDEQIPNEQKQIFK